MMDGAGNSESQRAPTGGLAEVGSMLRDRRIELRHSIETVANQTHIKVSYLKAIEEGRRRDLPGAAYTIGFVRTYADFLGFDGNRLVTDFHAQLAGTRARTAAGQDAQPAPELPRLTITPVTMAGAAMVVALIGFFLWGYLSDDGRSTVSDEETPEVAEGEATDGGESPAATETEQAATDAAAPATEGAEAMVENSAADENTAAAAPADQDPPATAPVEHQVPPEAAVDEAPEPAPDQVQEVAAGADAGTGKIVLRAKLESWVQITNEKGEPILSRVLRAGETYTVPNEQGLMMTTGNAGGIEILLDGKKLKSLGSVGLVRRNVPLDPKKLKDGSAFKPASNTQSGG